jgi:hypothetical protein
MTLFLRRFFGALVFDPSAFENVEADRGAILQSLAVVALAAIAGGVATINLGVGGVMAWVSGAALVIGAWLVWIAAITAVGTITFPEPQTHSGFSELVRTLGFAMAPGVFLAFAAMRAAAPVVILIVSVWIISDTFIAMRQALDYRSTARAVIVSITAWCVALGAVAAVAVLFTKTLD